MRNTLWRFCKLAWVALPVLALMTDALAGDKRRFSAIKVIEATYGGNCAGVPKGNATQTLAAACDNQRLCNFRIYYRELGSDPAPGCEKGFAVSYRCSGSSRLDRCLVDPEAGAGGEEEQPNNFCLLHCPQNR
jgi:hypothetical protein